MNFVIAVVVGIVIGGIGGFVLRQRQRESNALWLAPAFAVAGAVLASGLASALGNPGYGWKEATLQVVLAAAGVGAVAALVMRKRAAES